MITTEQFARLPKYARDCITQLQRDVDERVAQVDALKGTFDVEKPVGIFYPRGLSRDFTLPMTEYSHARFFERPHSIDVRYEGDWISLMGDQTLEIQARASNSLWVKVRDYAHRS
jgi:hypothetical protein